MKPIQAKKRFGQNFLTDQVVIGRIISSMRLDSDDFFLEIGPGQGAITFQLVDHVKQLNVVEIDRDLVKYLTEHPQGKGIKIYQSDVLKFDFASIDANKSMRLFGNLPYNISTPLLFHLLKFLPLVDDMHFMLQKEVADRIVADPGNKQYGRLSVMLQYHFEVNSLFDIYPTAFYPQPKVTSSFIRLKPIQEKPRVVEDLTVFDEVVRMAFVHRRKTLKNNLKTKLGVSDFDNLQISPTLRAENLSVDNYIKISNYIHEQCKD
ncbi:MAG: 16S rRNA (adenine(1518)-N(6)/adenine(1519)-N(6))-dimethyltransferase RsmA [Methylococcales bacterium]|jgi:16S rRNA (adenine1518-N6/adenine1519-N6)-dimethyltransferase|nr:16S rRNA (adenine(1518)-N(6)/adenine(1519)-N(6))-dimethyltransferase RsmA [Methylococcales bacterium]MBT7408445.1 16S rRNA (adenine(1518)-N(6)/adenine(1519)-N(6))-dimethyltransferase RsmA [Methylococcales bacterium]